MTRGDRQGDRILCIRLSALGDVAHALNALALLRDERPEAFIAWAVEQRFAALLEAHPHIDELIVLPRSEWGRMAWNPLLWPRLFRQRRAVAERLRTMRFDVSIDFQSSMKSSWLVRAANAAMRIGFDRPVSREGNVRAQNRVVAVSQEGMHRVERDLALLAPLGIAPRFVPAALGRPERAVQRVDRALADAPGDGPLVVIHPGTSEFAAFKRWPVERYARVADRLVSQRAARVVVTAGPAERAMAQSLVSAMEGQALAMPPDGGLMALAELLRRADLFMGSDTGPMHIASSLGTPLVALFGPKDPVQTGPFCSRSVVVVADAACRPCSRRRCRSRRCMLLIEPETVTRAALDVLDGGGRCRAEQGVSGE